MKKENELMSGVVFRMIFLNSASYCAENRSKVTEILKIAQQGNICAALFSIT